MFLCASSLTMRSTDRCRNRLAIKRMQCQFSLGSVSVQSRLNKSETVASFCHTLSRATDAQHPYSYLRVKAAQEQFITQSLVLTDTLHHHGNISKSVIM